MNPGKEYEQFVFEKCNTFFKDFVVIKNDKIIGKQSKIKREIDVSIKGRIDKIDILYIVQCKDHKKPADIKIIGEFSSVIKDVEASKGFLICTSGFTKTIYDYAKTLGIELLTVEDINSIKWKIDIKIPIIYIKKKANIIVSTLITINQALADLNSREIQITDNDLQEVSLDGGHTIIKLIDYINHIIESEKIDVSETKNVKLDDPNLLLHFAGIWVAISFDIIFNIETKYFLKYITPDEYSQISDHINKRILPLKVQIKNANIIFDDSYIEIEEDKKPVFTNLNLEIEENLTPFLNVTFTNIELFY